MERNDDNIGNLGGSTNADQGGLGGSTSGTPGSYGNSGDLTGAEGYGAGGPTAAGAAYGSVDSGLGASNSGSLGNAGTTGATGSGTSGEGMTDRARELAGDARERLADTGSTLRDRAGSAKNSLADMLEAGANRLAGQGGSPQLAGATGTGTMTADANRLSAVAGGLQGSADWLREADLDGVRQGIENQVRTNPGRSLLLAVGLGYLVGKAFRR